jgi:hypothetical protein
MTHEHAVIPQVKRQFTMLIYPFRHALGGKQRSSRLRRLVERWRPWLSRLDRDNLKHALDDTYFFLPYIRKLLFPEEVRGLQKYYEAKAQRRIRALLVVLTVVGLPTVLLNGLFTFDLVTPTGPGIAPVSYEGFQYHRRLWLPFAGYAVGMYGLTFLVW